MSRYDDDPFFEGLVAERLATKGVVILKRNYSGRGFEIDILAQWGKDLLCVEVKARDMPFHNLGNLLTKQKKKSLVRGVQSFLYGKKNDFETIRFDLALVLVHKGKPFKIQYTQGVFLFSDHSSRSVF